MTLITAHEGCEGTPENTLYSVQAGIKAGADIIEVDISTTKDKVAVLSHSSNIVTKSGKMKPLSDFMYKELLALENNKELVFDHPQGKITRLVEVFEIIRSSNKILNLDVKNDNSIDTLIDTVRNEKMTDYVFISGCERIRASHLKTNYPEFQVLLNVGESVSILNGMDSMTAVKTICRYATLAGCCGINIPYKYCTMDLVNYAHLRFLPVSVWTIDDPSEMKKYIDMGVFSITTNKPEKLRSIMNSENQ